MDTIKGKSAEERLQVRQTLSQPLIEDLRAYMREQLAKLSRGHDLAKGVQLHPEAVDELQPVLDDGRVCLINNAAERGLRGIAL
ncbi:IS66 family transposase [Bradyrhizobium elkanii]|uniref:IS66 family transposase n=1 Tax=Bradyrhizobium elkanii TaxID=29448 RepID=UPI003BAD3568